MKKLFTELFIAPTWAVAYALVEYPSHKAVGLFLPLYFMYQYYFMKQLLSERKAIRAIYKANRQHR